jgi:hypothetical protein
MAIAPQRTSSCLALLALLSSFPVSLGEATHMTGEALIGVSSVSEILDQFFKKQELAGHKAPAWKNEAQAMISLMQGMKDINMTTQATVDGYVRSIIATLETDVNNTAVEQARDKITLEQFENQTRSMLSSLDTQLAKVKTLSGTSKDCRDKVIIINGTYYGPPNSCTDADRTGGGTCPTECGKPSKGEFELTAEAKRTYTCDFEAGDSPEQCVDRLWGKVEMTKQNLTNKYNHWATEKGNCEAHMARCAKCNPIWNNKTQQITLCNGKRDMVYDAYCTLQTKQNDFCSANNTLHSQWTTVLSPAQVDRAEEYSDLKFIICIFKKYLQTSTFTKPMIDECFPRETAADFYSFASPPGELSLPNIDASAVPSCYGAIAHSASTPLFDMTGLINEMKIDGHAQTVSVADHVYAPAADSSSVFCTALTQSPY